MRLSLSRARRSRRRGERKTKLRIEMHKITEIASWPTGEREGSPAMGFTVTLLLSVTASLWRGGDLDEARSYRYDSRQDARMVVLVLVGPESRTRKYRPPATFVPKMNPMSKRTHFQMKKNVETNDQLLTMVC